MTRIAYLLDLLDHPEKIRQLVRDDILALKEKFGDERRTAIAHDANGDFSEEDLIAQDNVLVAALRLHQTDEGGKFPGARGRGGRGVKGMGTRQEDEVISLLFARTLDHILFLYE